MHLRHLNRYVFLQAEGAAGAGGGGAGAQGAAGAAGSEPKPMTEEEVGRIVNAAITTHLKRSLGPAIGEALGGLKLDEQIAAAVAKIMPPKPQAGAGGGDDDPSKGKGGAGTKEFEDRIKQLAEQLETEKKARVDAEQRRVNLEQEHKLAQATSQLRNALQPKVRGELLDVLVDNLVAVKKTLKVGDDGSPTLRVKRAPYKGAPEQDEDLPLAEAVPILLGSKDISPFLPAPGGQQSVDGGKQTARRASIVSQPGTPPTTSHAGTRDNDKAQNALAALEKAGIDPSVLS